jgi:hypothetical protein
LVYSPRGRARRPIAAKSRAQDPPEVCCDFPVKHAIGGDYVLIAAPAVKERIRDGLRHEKEPPVLT